MLKKRNTGQGLKYLRYNQSSRARFANIQEDLDRQTSAVGRAFSLFPPSDPKFCIQLICIGLNLERGKLYLALIERRPNISEMTRLY